MHLRVNFPEDMERADAEKAVAEIFTMVNETRGLTLTIIKPELWLVDILEPVDRALGRVVDYGIDYVKHNASPS